MIQLLPTKILMKQPKEGALIVGERDVLSINIRARERDAHFNPPLLAASLIFQTSGSLKTDDTENK